MSKEARYSSKVGSFFLRRVLPGVWFAGVAGLATALAIMLFCYTHHKDITLVIIGGAVGIALSFLLGMLCGVRMLNAATATQLGLHGAFIAFVSTVFAGPILTLAFASRGVADVTYISFWFLLSVVAGGYGLVLLGWLTIPMGYVAGILLYRLYRSPFLASR